jgi:alpha-galactosidase
MDDSSPYSVTGTPGAVYQKSGRYDVFAVSTTGVLLDKIYTGGVWANWQPVAPASPAHFVSGATAVVGHDGAFHVFTVDSAQHLWQWVYRSGAASWANIASNVTGVPGVTKQWNAATDTTDRFDVFIPQASTAQMVHFSYINGTWNPRDIVGGGGLVAGAAAVVDAAGTYHVFTINTDGVAYQALLTPGSNWAWQQLGGTVTGTPGLTYDGGSRYDLYAPAPSNGIMYHKEYTGSYWSGWQNIGGGNFV